MRILVTGATGGLGGPILSELVRVGVSVRACTRRRPRLETSGVEWVHVRDIRDRPSVGAAMDGVDAVLHMAGIGGISSGNRHAASEYMSVNVGGTRTVLDAAEACGVHRIVHLSSVRAAAGADLSSSLPAYGASKRDAEEEVLSRTSAFDGGAWVLRPCLVYGPGIRGGIERLAQAVRLGLPIPVPSDVAARSLTFVGNLLRAILCCLQAARVTSGVYTLSDLPPLAVPEWARGLAEGAGRRLRLVTIPSSIVTACVPITRLLPRIGPRISAAVEKAGRPEIVDGSRFWLAMGVQAPFSTWDGLRLTGRVAPTGDPMAWRGGG